jgi:RHS repeat-associated protein
MSWLSATPTDTLSEVSAIMLPPWCRGIDAEADVAGSYLGARYTQNRLARFLSPDDPSFGNPFDPQSMNQYAYAYNNPLGFVDPTGHQGDCVAGYDASTGLCHGDGGWADAQRFFYESWQYLQQQLADAARRAAEASRDSARQLTHWAQVRVDDCKTGTGALCNELFDTASEGIAEVAGVVFGGGLSGGARRILGGLAPRAGESIRKVILSRGGKAINVNEAGHWADKTLAAAAKAAAAGDQTARRAIKIAKDASRLGQKF